MGCCAWMPVLCLLSAAQPTEQGFKASPQSAS